MLQVAEQFPQPRHHNPATWEARFQTPAYPNLCACRLVPATLKETIVLDDPEAMCRAALLSLGVTLIAVPHALPHLERGTLVRLVPQWYADGGPISIYYASRTLQPTKTQVFVDFVAEASRRDRLAERFAGSLG